MYNGSWQFLLPLSKHSLPRLIKYTIGFRIQSPAIADRKPQISGKRQVYFCLRQKVCIGCPGSRDPPVRDLSFPPVRDPQPRPQMALSVFPWIGQKGPEAIKHEKLSPDNTAHWSQWPKPDHPATPAHKAGWGMDTNTGYIHLAKNPINIKDGEKWRGRTNSHLCQI